MLTCALLVLTAFLAITDGKFFRNDYHYNADAQGWLKLQQIPATWDEARLRCYFEGSVIASPLNLVLESAMLDMMVHVQGQEEELIFTGVSAMFSNGDFYSVEGVPLNRIPLTWLSVGQPTNDKDAQCLAMVPGGYAATVKCDEPLPYICYKRDSQNMPAPSNCGTVDPGYVFDSRTGHCYKFHRFGQSWSRAFMACSAEGGYLTVINSEVEATVLREIMYNNPASKVFAKYKDYIGVGIHDWSQHGLFMTVHGETLSEAGYDKWSPGEPNNYTTGEYCGSMYRTALLNDVWCEETIPFICEMEPGSLSHPQTHDLISREGRKRKNRY